MKKTLIAVAALSAMAASAMAANVTVYGKIDQGLQVQNVKNTGEDSKTTFVGKSGISSGSRWGLKGTEEIADGYTVGFVIESGFDGFTGEFSDSKRLFNREAFVSVDTPFGQWVAGRTGTLSDGCTGDIISGPSSPFGTTYGIAAATTTTFGTPEGTRTDRAVRYVSPKFAGVQIHAEYANMGVGTYEDASGNTKELSQKFPNKKRYGGVGVSYANGPLYVAVAAETVRQASNVTAEDPQLYSLAANYDFGVAKVFAGYQYAKDTNPVKGDAKVYDKYNAGTLGVSAPVAGGTVMASVAYRKGDTDLGDVKRMTGAIGYKYSLSKRTYLYTDVAYAKEEVKAPTNKTTKTTEFNVGLCHNF